MFFSRFAQNVGHLLLWAMAGVKAVGDSERSSLVTPLLRLGDEAGMEITDKEGDAQHWMDAIVPALARNEPAQCTLELRIECVDEIGCWHRPRKHRRLPCPLRAIAEFTLCFRRGV